MVRMAVGCSQYVPFFPIIELDIQGYHEGSKEDYDLADEIIGMAIILICQIIKEMDAELLSEIPKGKIKKDAKIAAFMTVRLKNAEGIEEFMNLIVEVFRIFGS